MADEQAQMSTQQAAPPGDESSKKLREVMEAIDRAIDSNKLSEDAREDWQKLSSVLNKIKSRLTTPKDPRPEDDSVKKGDDREDHPEDDSVKKDGQEEQQQPLPQSKREELANILLPEIEFALGQLMKQPRQEPSSDGNVRKKKLMSAGCSPFSKLRLSQEKKSREQRGGRHEVEEEAVSVKLLVRLAEHVLEPEQYYKWTTSYVDESRIYGWDEQAEEVMKSLIGPDEGDFRAAAITGIHGSGKTALAQKVFVHDLAKDHFPIRLWVCVGPPDSEDRFNLLYRMLDNLGLDTNMIEDVVVDGAKVVNRAREKQAEARLPKEELDALRKEAAEMAKKRKQEEEEEEGVKKRKEEDTTAAAGVEEGEKKEEAGTEDAKIKEEGEKKEKAGFEDADIIKEEYSKLLKQKIDDDKLLKQEIERSLTVENSKIGVLLYILHVTLSKTGYLIVFDDIRVYRERGDDWYSNLTLLPPPEGVEWSDRLAYGLPKMTGKHRNAVLVTCRKEDDAKVMVRTGRVFRPQPLEVDNGWRLFEREYKLAKGLKESKEKKTKVEGEEDLLFEELKEMKKEIVEKCLGLPVAIIEAAKGFALSDYGPLPEPPEQAANKSAEDKIGSSNKGVQTQGDQTEATTDNKPDESS